MDRNRREYLTNRLVSGKIYVKVGVDTYCVIAPTPDIIYRANEVYYGIMEKNRFNEWVTKADATKLLIANGIWTADGDKNLEAIEKRIEDLKVELYQSLMRPEEDKAKIRKTLKMVQEKQSDMLTQKHMYDYMTAEGFAESAKSRFMLESCVRDLHGKPLNADTLLLQKINTEVDKNRISVEEFRELARTDPWRSSWSCLKEKALEVIGDEQRTLILFSKMYDGAHEHPECPSEDVINDDDMFDGWMIIQRREREKDKMTQTLNKSTQFDKKHKNANEIFVMAKTQQHANEIYNYNDLEGKLIQRQRAAAIQQYGSVEEKDLPDVKQHLMIQGMQLSKEKIKGK